MEITPFISRIKLAPPIGLSPTIDLYKIGEGAIGHAGELVDFSPTTIVDSENRYVCVPVVWWEGEEQPTLKVGVRGFWVNSLGGSGTSVTLRWRSWDSSVVDPESLISVDVRWEPSGTPVTINTDIASHDYGTPGTYEVTFMNPVFSNEAPNVTSGSPQLTFSVTV